MPMNIQFISVLSGPRSGKGTQCAQLQDTFKCLHLSVGDLLRGEAAKPDSLIAGSENMKLGRVGPKDVTVGTLDKHIKQASKHGMQTFFLDGFPRKLDQAEYFEEHVGPITLILVFDCPQEILVQRLLQRGRGDDDTETIQRRATTFQTTTAAAVEKYDSMAKVVRIQVSSSKETVFGKVKAALISANIELPRAHQEISDEITIDPSEYQAVKEIDADTDPGHS